MSTNISRAQVDEIIRRYIEATNNGVFTSADVLIATAEYLGRIIVELADTPISGMQAAQIASDHLFEVFRQIVLTGQPCNDTGLDLRRVTGDQHIATMRAGMSAKGFNMGGHWCGKLNRDGDEPTPPTNVSEELK